MRVSHGQSIQCRGSNAGRGFQTYSYLFYLLLLLLLAAFRSHVVYEGGFFLVFITALLLFVLVLPLFCRLVDVLRGRPAIRRFLLLESQRLTVLLLLLQLLKVNAFLGRQGGAELASAHCFYEATVSSLQSVN